MTSRLERQTGPGGTLAKEAADADEFESLKRSGRYHGFRPTKRYFVFQVLPDTLGLGPEVWRVMSKAHDLRNRTEYEGSFEADERLVKDLIAACRAVAKKLDDLPPLRKSE